ncbi:potassium uptake protein [Fictibacillus macauensis ZFHKF-1]|uniref:Potassium uptake protein n=1 Tax=Fictibacillus macauensis ZFHKF-1 TaxID=1196324 RepID=I8AH20_9BACL|nr:TrkA family potassium uptake protein [Fictibacillus macauensis]EIT84957.1 potassium uptake protein [Fictibacillus macauensis ZFHKF-1]
MKRQFAVIGLGRFGGSMCKALSDQGLEVLAIDVDEERVNEYASIATHAVVADSTDEAVMKSLGIRNVEHVIVAIGENIQASILTTLLLKEIGIEKITVKAQNDYHEKVLVKIGANRIIHPERDMGVRIAHQVVSKNILDYLEISNEYTVAEVSVTDEISGKTIRELNLRATYGCNIVAMKRNENILVSPSADQQLSLHDVLIMIGAERDLARFENSI